MTQKYRKPSPVKVQMHIRLTLDLKKWLERSARQDASSLNDQVVEILEAKRAAETSLATASAALHAE